MKKNNLKNLFQKDKKIVKKISNPFSYERVFHDWRILTLSFGVLLVIFSFFAWKIYLSLEVGGGYIKVENSNSDILIKIIDEKRLEKSIYTIKERESNFLKIESEPTELTNPAR